MKALEFESLSAQIRLSVRLGQPILNGSIWNFGSDQRYSIFLHHCVNVSIKEVLVQMFIPFNMVHIKPKPHVRQLAFEEIHPLIARLVGIEPGTTQKKPCTNIRLERNPKLGVESGRLPVQNSFQGAILGDKDISRPEVRVVEMECIL